MTNRQKQALQTKEKIFKCALGLFAQQKYENVTVQDICTEAEVSIGAFYHHFKSKGNILDEGYRLFDQEAEELWDKGHPEDPLDSIRFLIEKQSHSMENMGAMASLQYFKNQLSSSEKYIIHEERFFYQAILSSIKLAIENGSLHGNATTITEDILSVTRGIIYDWCLHNGSYALREKSLRMLDMILQYYH